jgi:hypothetical protein
MSAIPVSPNIAELGGQIAQAPMNQVAEYARVAALKSQTAAQQQQTQQAQAMAPGQQQMQAEQVKAAQMQNAQVDAMNRAYQGAFKPDAQGNLSLDTDALQQSLAQGGHGAAIPQVMKGITEYKTSVANLQEQQQKIQTGGRDALGNLGYALQQAKYDSQLAHTLLADELNDPSLAPQQKQQIAQMQQAIAQNPAMIQSLADQWVANSPAQQAKAVERQKAQAGDWKEGGGGTLVNVNPQSPQFGKRVQGVGPVDQQEMNSYLTAAKVPGETLPPEQRTPASFVSWKAKQSPMAVVMGNQLQGAAVDQAAQRYLTDGSLPAGFSRSPGTTSAIVNRAAQIAPEQNIASNKATYQADTGSLKKLQQQFDAMDAFEGTALRNLDLYAQTAKKVYDLGARFANVPLRLITAKMIGTDNMAALNAARQAATAEVAKVLGSATGSGVLSDSQKKEAQDVADGNLPMSATMAVVDTLKQDMANRHQSYLQDIAAIKKRLSGGTNQGASVQNGNAGANSSGFNWSNFSEHK